MAIQNFVAGGFYGKLGAMVGQRWKNKRTLRTWVKPKNPRTEAQQANRGRFGGCVQLAQIAMQMNWKAPCWQSESLTEWNLRMRSATMLNKSELEPFNKIPLFPYAYVAKHAIHELKVKSKDPSGKVTFSAVGELPTEDRNISVLLGYINASTGAYDMELFLTTLTTNEDDEKVFTIEIDDVSKVNNDSIYLICSNDDEEHDNESIYSNQIGAAGKITKVFDTNIIEYTRTANKHFFTFAEEYFPSETSVINVKLYGVVAGNYETLTLPSVTLENFGGHFGFSMEQSVSDNFHIIAFASLSNIQIESISADSETVLSKAENTLNSFSSDDLTRTEKATLLDSRTLTPWIEAWIPRILDTTDGWTADGIKTVAIQAGVLREWIPTTIQILKPTTTLQLRFQRDDTLSSMYPIFNSESKITEGRIYTVVSEVTYEHDLTNLHIEDTKKETTWDNTLWSTIRWEDTWEVVYKEDKLDLTNETQEVSYYARTFNGLSTFSKTETFSKRDDNKVECMTKLDVEKGSLKHFLGTGSTITFSKNFVINEVTYKPLIVTQNVVYTDNTLFVDWIQPLGTHLDGSDGYAVLLSKVDAETNFAASTALNNFAKKIAQEFVNNVEYTLFTGRQRGVEEWNDDSSWNTLTATIDGKTTREHPALVSGDEMAGIGLWGGVRLYLEDIIFNFRYTTADGLPFTYIARYSNAVENEDNSYWGDSAYLEEDKWYTMSRV